jgi:putative cardiolipin synthase
VNPVLRALRRALPFCLLFVALSTGCALGPARQQMISERLAAEQDRTLDCVAPADCAAPSPFHALIGDDDGRHRALLLEQGADALRIRLHLVRAARRSIDLQTYIFQDEASSDLLLTELLAAARRGVRVRVLVDQLFSLSDPDELAQLALAHRNFELRFYNPTFREARTQAWEFAAGALCCFSRFNQRMHSKLFAIDGAIAIIGGRNYRDSYYDLDPAFAYYDRDVLVMGPVLADMMASFESYWVHRRSLPVARLHDVGRALLRREPGQQPDVAPVDTAPDVRARLERISADADDQDLIDTRFIEPIHIVQSMRFVADAPAKIGSRRAEANAVSLAIADLLENARDEVLLQTPYLVLGRATRDVFEAKRDTEPELTVRVSTNSLAATDAYPVYALTYKYKKRYLRELGFRLYEFKPHPAQLRSMIETGAADDPPRVSMHAKSAVIDGEISLIGTHNFDPRSDKFNTEAAVIIHDRDFAAALAASIQRDMAPENSWVIAPRERGVAPFYRLSRLLESISTALPLFDLWPFRYASSFELKPGCPPVPRSHPDFYVCHDDVGDFPEVESVLKRILTRLATAFGAPALPVL